LLNSGAERSEALAAVGVSAFAGLAVLGQLRRDLALARPGFLGARRRRAPQLP